MAWAVPPSELPRGQLRRDAIHHCMTALSSKAVDTVKRWAAAAQGNHDAGDGIVAPTTAAPSMKLYLHASHPRAARCRIMALAAGMPQILCEGPAACAAPLMACCADTRMRLAQDGRTQSCRPLCCLTVVQANASGQLRGGPDDPGGPGMGQPRARTHAHKAFAGSHCPRTAAHA